MAQPRPLSADERSIYQWQLWVDGFGEPGQEKLKGSSVLISRCGGLGGAVAYQLAAAGVGRLVLAHAGNVRQSDLNRQILMTHDWLGKPRVECARQRLLELNPRMEVVAVNENINDDNAARLVELADVTVDCAPLFPERYAMNRESVRQRKPLVECAVYELEAQITSMVPGRTPCLACLYPDNPPAWKREFPVFGAVASAVGSLGAMEAIKLIANLGEPLLGQMLTFDLRDMAFRKLHIVRRPNCAVCGSLE